MNSFSPASELRVVNAMIDTIERTLAEFSDAKTKSELYRELSSYHGRQDALEAALASVAVENEAFAAPEVNAGSDLDVDSHVEVDQDPDLPALDSDALDRIDMARFDAEGAAQTGYVDLVPAGASSFDEAEFADVPDVETMASEDDPAPRFI